MAGEPVAAPVTQPQTPEPDDGLTAAEREFVNSGGVASDALLAENPDYKPPAVDPNAPAPAAPGAAAAQPAAAPGADKEFDTDDDSAEAQAARAAGRTPKRVNYNKFKRTEDELTATKAQLAKATEASTRIDERMKLINEALAAAPASPQQQAAEDADPAPDPERDIFGYVRWQGRQIERLNERLQEGQEERTADRNTQELSNFYKSDAANFARTDPTFLGAQTPETSAYAYLIQNRMKELESGGIGHGLTPEAAHQKRVDIVLQEEHAVVQQAKRDNVSPSKRLYDLAVGRGFRKNEAEAALAALRNGGAQPAPAAAQPAAAAPALPGTPLGGANQNPPAAANGSAATAPAAAQPNVAAEIQAIKNAQPAALSLSGGGGVPADPLTPQMLADMPDEEFQAVLSRLSPARQRELFGT